MKMKFKYENIEPNRYKVWLPSGFCVSTVCRTWDETWKGHGTTGLCSWQVQQCETRQQAAEAMAAMFKGLQDLGD